MSLEKNIERIADALESLVTYAAVADGSEAASATVTNVSNKDGGKAKRKTAAEKKAEKAAKVAKAAEPDGPTREDVADVLTEFCKEGPGRTVAKEIFEEFKAGSISTLDPKTYQAFIDRLNEVSGG